MADAVMERVAERIAEHARSHRLSEVGVVLHGGEPLLAGRARIDRLASVLGQALDGTARLRLSVQTNGTLLDEHWLALFHRHGIRVGVSLDGDRAANDRHRRRAGGRSSHAAVEAGLRLLRKPEHRDLYAGLLCTVDPLNDPISTYEALISHEPPRIDFLLPHATWQFPPPQHDPLRTPYAAWLIAVFERWYRATPMETRVRLFEDIVSLTLAGTAGSEAVGSAVPGFIVVETDGSIELDDAYKAAYDGAAGTGLNLLGCDFDTAARSPLVAEARLGREGLAEGCRACRVVDLCGGGIRAHRFHPDTGFANPSVYCSDLVVLTEHIRNLVRSDVRVLLKGLM